MASGSARMGTPATARIGGPRWVGWALLAPAALLMIFQLIVPGVRTVLISLRGSTAFGRSRHPAIGLGGFRHADGLGTALASSLACGAMLLVAVLLLGPVLGLLLARSAGAAAVIVRSLLGLLLCCYAPTAMVLGLLFRDGYTELGGLAIATAMIYLPVAVAGSALVWSALFADRGASRTTTARTGRAVVAGTVMVAVACLAAVLQSFEVPVLLAGGRMVSTANLILYSLQSARFDTAAAVCTVLMIIIALLGLLAGAFLIVIRAGVVLSPRPEFGLNQRPPQVPANSSTMAAGIPTARRRRSPAGVAAVGLVLLVLVIMLIFHRDWALGLLHTGTDLPGPDGQLILQTLFNTWVPSGIGAAAQVVVALAAGFGIGYCQPLGQRSRWLLLGFAPWLFAGGLPLIVAEYESRGLGTDSEGWTDLIPSVWVISPAIFALSWLCADLRRHRDPLPVIGASLLTLVICWLVQAQDLLRPMFLTTRTITAPMLSFRSVQTSFRADGTLWLVLPLPVLLTFAVIAAAAMIMLGRVRLVAGAAVPETSSTARADDSRTVTGLRATPGEDRRADRRRVRPRPTS